METNSDSNKTFKPWIEAIHERQPTQLEEDQMHARLMDNIQNYDLSATGISDEKREAKVGFWQWLLGTPNKVQFGFAGSFLAALGLSVGLYLSSGVSTPAFASVIQKLSEITSMVYSGQMRSNGLALMNLEVYYQAPYKLRIVNTPINANGVSNSVINVLDIEKGKGLIILSQGNQAVPFDFAPGNLNSQSPDKDFLNWRETLLTYKGPVETLAPTYVNNILATGYRIEDDNMKITLWVDSTTELPISIKVETPAANPQFVFEADVRFNESLDSELFNLDTQNYQIMQSDE